MFKPAEPVTENNFAIMAEYGCFGENVIRAAYFGSAKEFAEWLSSFNYSTGDVFGWEGDSATMEAVESYRTDRDDIRAIPEFITEYNTNAATAEIIGADQFSNLYRMFRKDPEYTVNRYFCDNAKVYAVFYGGQLSSYVWHVPFGSAEVYG